MMNRDALLGIFGTPTVIGGVYMWTASGKTRKQRIWIALIAAYDVIFLTTFHWWLKAF